MDWQGWFVLITIVVAVILFIREIFPIDVVAILIAVVLMAAGIVTIPEGLSGFSNEATITILALLILSAGLESTGAIDSIGERVAQITGNKLWSVTLVILLTASFCSAFLNNTAVIAIFMPVVITVARKKGFSASKLLMPLAYASILGGMCTIIGTSTNLLVNTYAKQAGIEAFGFFEFLAVGIFLVEINILYSLFIGQKLLKPRRQVESGVVKTYGLDNYLAEIEVQKDSKLISDGPEGFAFFDKHGIEVIKIKGQAGREWIPQHLKEIREGDKLLVTGSVEAFAAIRNQEGLKIAVDTEIDDRQLTTDELLLVEAVVSPTSDIAGKHRHQVSFRNQYGAFPLSISFYHDSRLPQRTQEFRPGDSVVLELPRDNIRRDAFKRDFLVINKHDRLRGNSVRKLLSVIILVAVVLFAALEITPILISSLAGVVLMVVSGCIDTKTAYRKVEWRVFFLLAGLIPLGTAIINTGLDNRIAILFLELVGGTPPWVVIGTLYLFTMAITNVMSNAATALLMAPIAISISARTGFDPHALLMTITFAASTSFLSPMGYQTLALIYGPGKYKMKDYLVVGGPLSMIIWLTASYMIYEIYF